MFILSARNRHCSGPAMTDLDFEDDKPLEKRSWQTEDDDGKPQKGKPDQIHSADAFQKSWERSSKEFEILSS